jgi:membrane associated rhomboid family serine protease
MFPIRTLRKTKSTPYVTYILIAINALVFAWELTQPRLGDQFWALALVPCQASRSLFTPETLLDSIRTMFLHGGWVHLLGNMMFLFVFGPNVEDYLGKARYVIFYFACGMAANLLHTAINWNVCVPSIGASGAIAGIMGGFLLLYPATRIQTVAFFFRIPVGITNVQAFYMLIYFFAMDLINGLASLGARTAQTSGVAFWAHIGGFIMGLALAFTFMLFRTPPEVDPFEYLDA